jgi:single-strand DNA-binding protein
MPALNKIQLIGRLGKDPETRFTPKGSKICHFSLAVDRHYKTTTGEMKEATDWFNIEVWGKLGEFCQTNLCKGRLVYLEGRMQTDRYEHEGETHYYTKVIARNLQALDRKRLEPPVVEEEEEPIE